MTDELALSGQREVALGSIAVPDHRAVIETARQVANALAGIIDDRKLYTVIRGRKFVRVEGWTTLGAMLGVVPREVEVRALEDGGFEATVELVRVSDGVVIGRGSAICGMDEPTWANRPSYARRSMAVTRATGKAFRLAFSWIMTLAGYEPTPAEEMPVVEAEYREVAPAKRAPTPPPKVERPYPPEVLRGRIAQHIRRYKARGFKFASSDERDNARGVVISALSDVFESDGQRQELLQWLVGRRSLEEADDATIKALLDWINPQRSDGGGYTASADAKTEAAAAYRVAMGASRQDAA